MSSDSQILANLDTKALAKEITILEQRARDWHKLRNNLDSVLKSGGLPTPQESHARALSSYLAKATREQELKLTELRSLKETRSAAAKKQKLSKNLPAQYQSRKKTEERERVHKISRLNKSVVILQGGAPGSGGRK